MKMGTYHSISLKHILRYSAEFEYRINCRFKLKDTIFLRLTYIILRTSPMLTIFLRYS